MNHKHLAAIVILLACVLVVQGVLSFNKTVADKKAAAARARQTAELSAITLRAQRNVLEDLRAKTADLLTYLDAWEPHLARLSTADAGEVNINALLKQADLLLLSQRFELTTNQSGGSVPSAANETIPQIVRAHLTIEDDFVKSINWLGELESKLPTARLSNLEIARGQSGNDVRMNVVVDIPLARAADAPATASPTP